MNAFERVRDIQTVLEIPPKRSAPEDAARPLRVAAYCRVSTESEEQETSIELQEQRYSQLIDRTPGWESAGIFSERATGLNIKERAEFRAMMRKCRKGEIDLILTKSVSRFGRNTLDMLRALRELKALDIDVFFEKEHLWLQEKKTEIFFTALCAFAQGESTSMSQDIRWGVKEGFQSGTSGYSEFTCFGYQSDEDGRLAIDEPAAKIVRKIFEMRANGQSLGKISEWLHENSVQSPTGKARWSRETISKLLRNEKYTGDVLLQKTFVGDVLAGKQIKNTGQKEQFLIPGHHAAIVSHELFRMVSSR